MSNKFSQDKLYALQIDELIDFSFDENTVAVFPDMINRSVPGYSLMQSITGLIAAQTVTRDSHVYDLGCSLGASSLAVLNSVDHQDYQLFLLDQSEAMIENCQQLFNEKTDDQVFHFLNLDVRDAEINNASLVLLNLVLQFLPINDRQNVLNKIYSGLRESGALLLTEKTHAEDSLQNQVIDQLYVNFKKRSGYSDLEISQKRQALEKVMHTEPVVHHQQRLYNAGFATVIPVMQALNFTTLLAIK